MSGIQGIGPSYPSEQHRKEGDDSSIFKAVVWVQLLLLSDNDAHGHKLVHDYDLKQAVAAISDVLNDSTISLDPRDRTTLTNLCQDISNSPSAGDGFLLVDKDKLEALNSLLEKYYPGHK